MQYNYIVLIITVFNFKLVFTDELGAIQSQSGCRYRNSNPLPPEVFAIHANWGCYDYTREDFFLGGKLKVVGCSYQNFTVPGIVKDEVCVPFDFNSNTIQDAIFNSFMSKLMTQRWQRCCNDAQDCCQNILQKDMNKVNYCPSIWDGWTCFASASAGITEKKVCSAYAYSSSEPRCNHFSYKECFQNATWNDATDYSTCSITPRLITRNKWHIAMLSISVIICFPALLIFIIVRQLRTQKIFLIILLIGSIILRNIFVIMVKAIIIMNELAETGVSIMMRNPWSCKMLSFFEKTSANIVFTAMLLEGIFLHQLLTKVFAARRQNSALQMNYYYIVGFGLSMVMSVTWAIVMKINLDENCWAVDDSHYHWLNDSLRMSMLGMNIMLLAHITWTLWNSFKRKQDENHPAIRTLKAAIFCVPLFGLSFVFFIVRPRTGSCGWEQFYYFVSYLMEGFQGIAVTILHFYNDRDVKKILFTWFQRAAEYCNPKRQFGDDIRRETIEPRTTVSTVADSRSTITAYNEEADNSSAAVTRSNGKLVIFLSRPEFNEKENDVDVVIKRNENVEIKDDSNGDGMVHPNDKRSDDNCVSFI